MAAWLREARRIDVDVGSRRVAHGSWGERGTRRPPRPPAGESWRALIDLGNALLTSGYRVVSFDAPGMALLRPAQFAA